MERWRLPNPTSALGWQPTGVWIQDLDGDGTLDVVLAGLRALAFLRGVGDGTLDPAVAILDNPTSVHSILYIDVDRDGLDDIVFDSENSQQQSLAYRAEWIQQVAPGQFGTPRLVLNGIGGNTPMLAIDVNGDGAKDLVRVRNRIDWYPNTPNGAFGSRQTLSDEVGDVVHMVEADIDGDGDKDLYCSEGLGGPTRLVALLNVGGSYVLGEQLRPSIWSPGQVCALDVDLDGYLDPVWQRYEWTRYFPGVHNGVPELVQDRIRPEGIAAFDADNDGDVDVLSFGSQGTIWDLQMKYFERAERNLFERSVDVASPSFDAMAEGQPAVADLDGDGYLDAAAISLTAPSSVVVFPGGPMGIQASHSLPLAHDSNGEPCAVDLDGDGDMDLVIPSFLPGGLHVLAAR